MFFVMSHQDREMGMTTEVLNQFRHPRLSLFLPTFFFNFSTLLLLSPNLFIINSSRKFCKALQTTHYHCARKRTLDNVMLPLQTFILIKFTLHVIENCALNISYLYLCHQNILMFMAMKQCCLQPGEKTTSHCQHPC